MTGEGPPAALSGEAQQLQRLVGALAADLPGVREAVVVSADGLLIAASDAADPAAGHRLAAVVSGLVGLAGGAAHRYELGGLHKVVVDLTGGYLLITSLSPASVLGVVADRSAGLGTIAYEMTLFASRVDRLLVPATILELTDAMT